MIQEFPCELAPAVLGPYCPAANRKSRPCIFHIKRDTTGSSCGFQPTETLEQVGASHNIPDVEEAIRYLEESRALERAIQIRPEELANALKAGQTLQLLDVRAPEEHQIARIEGARLVTGAFAREVVERWPKDSPIVVHCHLGERSPEAAFFLINQGFTNVRSLTGGIDAWSAQVDPAVPKYAAALAHSK